MRLFVLDPFIIALPYCLVSLGVCKHKPPRRERKKNVFKHNKQENHLQSPCIQPSINCTQPETTTIGLFGFLLSRIIVVIFFHDQHTNKRKQRIKVERHEEKSLSISPSSRWPKCWLANRHDVLCNVGRSQRTTRWNIFSLLLFLFLFSIHC